MKRISLTTLIISSASFVLSHKVSANLASAFDSAHSAELNDISENFENQLSGLESSVEESTEEVPYGLEALTSWRSEYVYRGFALAGSSMEYQLAAQMAPSDTDSIDTGFFYGTETGSGDFSELAGFLDFRRDVGKYTYIAKLAYHEYGKSFFKSGLDIGMKVNYRINDAFDISGSASYNSGANGFYVESKISYYEEVSMDSYVTLDAGISAVKNYYQRDGMNHVFSKLAYNYNINDSVSVSPYVSAILGIDDDAKSHLLGGIYFAVSF